MTITRKCPGCKTTKDASAFTLDSNRASGLSTYCRECRAGHLRERKARYGSGMDPTVAERLWARVEKRENGCWIWMGMLRKENGYGEIMMNARTALTHRVSLLLHGIDIPKGMVVDHRCRDRACCNPEHLRVVTRSVNATENNDSPFAKNRRLTHCKRGHLLAGDNIRIIKTTSHYNSKCTTRHCIACAKIRAAEAKARKRPEKPI